MEGGHLMSLRGRILELSTMEAMPANSESGWNSLRLPSLNFVISKTSLFPWPLLFTLPFYSSVVPQTKVPHPEVAHSENNLNSRRVFSFTFNLFFNQPIPPIKIYTSHLPYPRDPSHCLTTALRGDDFFISLQQRCNPSGHLVVELQAYWQWVERV